MRGVYMFVSLVLVSLIQVTTAYKDYTRYQVWQFNTPSFKEIDVLTRICDNFQLDVWRRPGASSSTTDVLVSRDDSAVTAALQATNIQHTVMIPDVGRLVHESIMPHHISADLNTSRFYTVSEIHAYLDEQALACGADCEIISIGTSYEGRDLKVIKIGRPGSGRRAIWLDGGIHAREWLTPAVTTFFVDKLINDDGIDPDVTLLRDAYDWYIHPVVNPDGYDYTWTMDRMWRKTRSPNPPTNCVGTDPNRNFDFQWGPGDNNTCSEVYQGPSPESESEISSRSGFILGISSSVDLAISYHTYGEVLIMPWAYSTIEPPDIADLERLAGICIDAVNANSTLVYEYGQVGSPTGGISMDWDKGVGNIKYAYVMEMRGGQNGYGFLAPPSEILPTSLENWAGLAAMAKDLMP